MIALHQLDQQLCFPSPQYSLDDPNGLLAFGGDLSVPRLREAYRQGIFPWYSDGEPILWWSPDPRGVLVPEAFHCSRSLRKRLRTTAHTATLNHAFDKVVEQCANIPRNQSGTWITQDMQAAYRALHRSGDAHSVEIWSEQGELVGGLYGVAVGAVFCGESMFSHQADASKMAFFYLVRHLITHGGHLIDCQMPTPHLQSLGCKAMSRATFLAELSVLQDMPVANNTYTPQSLEYTP
ncbi:leucyl/phenylalanyl-tRNA--protein transferase [Aestuariibacter halophilus]|uniref:Leucyl/phenylalanyl-tRNA--protein transferase n=1 Tax=Fluctibacter halophilus TaxID=226011 RepID=A0ABS8G6C9_9ALTE|nr:leucyl/phenylalanyl-tRNA--protein transferase [Aestuariibacter halophilus]MCC2615405.1 leucyl/phenylalanyl-tRNA--protein transferase [Aestuariibacter halophilus]